MNAILSLFLSLAMLFSGGAALPAEVETVSTLAVQDVVLGYEGESYPLGIDFALSAGASQDELLLHFEAEDDEGLTLLPLSGKITRDGVTFALNNEGSAFTVSAETLNQMLGLEEGDVSSIETLAKGLESYFSALSALEQKKGASLDPETEAAMMEVVYSNMQDMVKEDVEWDFGSGEIPAVHVNGKVSGAGLFAILDGWLAMDDDTLSPALSGLLDLYNAAFGMVHAYAMPGEVTVYADKDETIGVISGADDGPTAIYVPEEEAEAYVPAENFTQLLSAMAENDAEVLAGMENTSAEMDIISAADGDSKYQVVNLFAVLDEEKGAAMNVSAESAIGADASNMYFALYTEEGSNILSYEVQTAVEGPIDNPSSMDVEMMMQNDSTIDFTDYTAEEVEEDMLYSSTGMYLNAGVLYEDGLEDTDVYMEINESNVRYAGGELNEESEPENVIVNLYIDQEKDEEGRLTSAYDLDVSANEEESLTVNFNTVLTESPAPDYFAAHEMVELPADGEDPAYNILSGNAMAVMGDLIAISANEDFAAFAEAFSVDTVDYEEEYTEEYTEEDYEDYEEYTEEEYDGEYDEEYAEDYEFATLEEAAGVFKGDLISYTAPEGFQLETVYVSGDGSYLNANYVTEDGRYITVNQEYYEEDYGLDYFSVADGASSLIEQPVASVYKAEGGYYYAQFYMNGGALAVYFDDCDAAGVEAILAGLGF